MTATDDAPTHERVSPSQVRITFPAPVEWAEAWDYCGEQNDFGYPAAGYGGRVVLFQPTTREDGKRVSTVALYMHRQSCD